MNRVQEIACKKQRKKVSKLVEKALKLIWITFAKNVLKQMRVSENLSNLS